MRLLVALAVLAVTGCADPPAAPEYLPPARCPAIVADTPGPLPAGFAAVEVRRCTYAMPYSPVVRSVERGTGPLDGLVVALRLPPQERNGDEPVCPAVAHPPMTLALTDAAGRTVMPAVPATTCGQPLPEVVAAVAALSWTTVPR